MDKYTASNGVEVWIDEDAEITYTAKNAPGPFSARENTQALREFFRAERDEELGRWRWPENPDYVVYPDEDGDVVVLNEGKGISSSIIIRRDIGTRNPFHPSTKAARAYFEAHPERKPWEDAKDGHLWLIRFDDYPDADVSALVKGGRFIYNDHCHEGVADLNDPTITAARRIWPESD